MEKSLKITLEIEKLQRLLKSSKTKTKKEQYIVQINELQDQLLSIIFPAFLR